MFPDSAAFFLEYLILLALRSRAILLFLKSLLVLIYANCIWIMLLPSHTKLPMELNMDMLKFFCSVSQNKIYLAWVENQPEKPETLYGGQFTFYTVYKTNIN